MENVTVSIAKPKTTPKDFFLWLGTMVALYVSVGSLIALLFRIIDELFPDPVFYSIDAYSTGIRVAIAALIVVFPIYFLITQYIQRDLRKNADKRDLGIRKGLIFFTLFIAGIALAADLIAVLYRFLGGDLPTTFLLKAASIFAVIGGVFWYYFKDLKDYWVEREKQSKIAGYGMGGLILLSVVGGFAIMGSPMTQRDLKIDSERVMHLQQIQGQMVYYWQMKGQLPATLTDLEAILDYQVPVDPATNQPYVYKLNSPQAFSLCATFARPTPEGLRSENYYSAPLNKDETWKHEAGEVCFDRTIDPELYPVWDEETRGVKGGAVYYPKGAPVPAAPMTASEVIRNGGI